MVSRILIIDVNMDSSDSESSIPNEHPDPAVGTVLILGACF